MKLRQFQRDVGSIKEALGRIESRIPDGPLQLPRARPPQELDPAPELARPLNLYASSVLGESVTDITRASFDSR